MKNGTMGRDSLTSVDRELLRTSLQRSQAPKEIAAKLVDENKTVSRALLDVLNSEFFAHSRDIGSVDLAKLHASRCIRRGNGTMESPRLPAHTGVD